MNSRDDGKNPFRMAVGMMADTMDVIITISSS